MSHTTEIKNSERIFGLDIFRSVAIIFVVIVHGGFLLNNSFLADFPYIKMIDGVDMFFVLSGFLIGNILLKEINKANTFGGWDLVSFWKRRWFRTLPTYYLILLLNYFIVKQDIIHEDITHYSWKFFVFLQNFSTGFFSFFWESWSLAVEEWFYILAPLMLLVFLKFLSPKKAFLLTVLLMISFPLFYRMSLLNATIDDFWYDVTFRKIVLTRLDSIAYGLLASWVFLYFRSAWTKIKIPAFMAGVGLIIFIVNYESPNTGFYKQVIYFSITPLSAMLLLPFAESIKKGRGIVGKAITHISKISYSMYLINLALVAEVIRDNFALVSATDGILKYFLYWTIVLTASTILYKYFEKPMMNLRDKKINLPS